MLVPDNSVLLIDKPYRWSSFDVIRYLKREYRRNTPKEEQIKKFKIGHAGTLDPLATGLLIVCTGKETKNIATYQGQEKEYIARVCFGATTKSMDAEFGPTNHKDVSDLLVSDIQSVLPQFTGEINQIPPKYSALKIDGKRAYELVREGKDFEIHTRSVTVHSIDLLTPDLVDITVLGNQLKFIDMRVVCSKGTYIRTLADDIGQAVGAGAYLAELARTRIGEYTVSSATTLDTSDFEPSISNSKQP
jgi:tRNA pseudouridine55 synthase